MSKNKNKALVEDTNRKIKAYQRLSLYGLIPGIIDLATVMISVFSSKRNVTLATGLSRYFYEVFVSNGVSYCSIFVSLGIAAIFIFFGYFALKAKLWANISITTLYLADFIFLIIISIQKGMEAGSMDVEAVFCMVIHFLFLLLQILALIFYFLANKALKKEKQSA